MRIAQLLSLSQVLVLVDFSEEFYVVIFFIANKPKYKH